jgi:hypothetical protein
MRRPSARTARTAAVTILAAASVAACGLSSTGTPSTSNNGGPSGTPIKVGISLSKTGNFSADGRASLRGYQLWAADVNSHGGLLEPPGPAGRSNDTERPGHRRQELHHRRSPDHVNLTRPVLSLLTVPAARWPPPATR